MAKRKKSSPRRGTKKGLLNKLEIGLLCLLMAIAAYMWYEASHQPTARTTASSVEKKSLAKKESARTERRQEQARSTAEKKTDAVRREEKKKASSERVTPAAVEYQLTHASDGDSFELADAQKRTFQVRLYGIDAPEARQAFGKDSRAHLLHLLKGQKVQLKTMYKDNYQRTVAIVYLSRDGKADALSVNQRQIQAGMAWVYDYFCTSNICNTWKLEEAMAQKQKLGLWKDDHPVPPWQWRKKQP